MSLLGGEIDTKDRLTFAGVARAFPSQSLARTLAIAVPGVFDDTLARSATATTWYGWTVTVTDASAQLEGFAISQIR